MIPFPKKGTLNPMLMKVIIISIVLHIGAAFVAGIITAANIVIQDDAQFDVPPAIEEETPPKEHQVIMKPKAAAAKRMNHLKCAHWQTLRWPI
jgi:hypothetical protein